MVSESLSSDTARGEGKRRAILQVAHDVFLAQGYAATSMSEIAAKLGGSKGTLYNYFRSKEELFSALMSDVCSGQAAIYFDPVMRPDDDRSLRESLIDIGVSLLEFLLLDDIIAVHRLVVAEADRFPELGQLFYEAGPHRGVARFTEYFRQAMAAGRIPEDDPKLVGQRLKDLVMSDVYLRRLWGVAGDLDPTTLRAHVTQSVDIFLRAFGPARAEPARTT